jgi:acyl carrier protein
MINFIELLNKVARVARPAHHEFVPIERMDEKFEETCFDSLDMLMIGMFMGMIYDIDDEIAKDFQPETVQELYTFIELNKKRDPESIEWALEQIK